MKRTASHPIPRFPLSANALRRTLRLALAGASLPAFAGQALVNGDFAGGLSGWSLAPGAAGFQISHQAGGDVDAAGGGALAWSQAGGAAGQRQTIASQCVDIDLGDGLERAFRGAMRLASGAATARIAFDYHDTAGCAGLLLETQTGAAQRSVGGWRRFRGYAGEPYGRQLRIPGTAQSVRVRLEVELRGNGPSSGEFDAVHFGLAAPQTAARGALVEGFDFAVDPNQSMEHLRDAHGLPLQFRYEFDQRGWVGLNTSDPAGFDTEGPGLAMQFAAYDGSPTEFLGLGWQVADSAGDISYWVVSPPLAFAPSRDCVSLFTRAVDTGYAERAQLRLSTAGSGLDVGTGPDSVGTFTTLLADINPTETSQTGSCGLGPNEGYPRSWCEVRVCGLPDAGSGRIAFRYFVSNTALNGDYIGLDRFRFPSPAALARTQLAITAVSVPSAVAGQAYTVSVAAAANGSVPTGTVIVGDGLDSCVATLQDGAGSCELVSSAAGRRTLRAEYAGDTRSGSASARREIDVLPPAGAATANLSIDWHEPNPVDLGSEYLVVVRVTGSNAAPLGEVLITDGDQSCTARLDLNPDPEAIEQTGECILPAALSGTRTLSAHWAGDAEHGAAQTQVSHQVGQAGAAAPEMWFVSDDPDASAPGESYLAVVAVTGAVGEAEGLVAVSDGQVGCQARVVLGEARCALASPTPGLKTLTASYSGSSLYKPATTTTPHQVRAGEAPSTLTITADVPDPSRVGEAVRVAVQVTGNAGTPSGRVTVSDAGDLCHIDLFAGTGSCLISLHTVGQRTLTATYVGDATYAASTDTERHTVLSADTLFRDGFE